MELTERSRKTRGGLGAAELVGEEGDRRRPSRKQTTQSGACGAPRARWRGVAEAEVVGASRGRASEARGGRWPRLWRSHGDGGARLRRGSRGRWIWRGEGEARGPRASVGASGRGDRGGAASASLSPRLVAGEGGSAGTCPVPTRVGGTGEGDAVRELGRLGRPGWLRARGVGRWPCGWVGLPGPGGFPPFFCFFVISFFYLFSLSVLFSFRAFRHFIKWCLLHHNYQCNIWQPPNIFALTFENLGCLSLIHILN